jgi:hypothetical protein
MRHHAGQLDAGRSVQDTGDVEQAGKLRVG